MTVISSGELKSYCGQCDESTDTMIKTHKADVIYYCVRCGVEKYV